MSKHYYPIPMSKAMIKAIRMVKGWNPDLRVKLSGVNRPSLWDWIEENRFGIGLADKWPVTPKAESEDWEQYEADLWHITNCVVWGEHDI